MRVVGDLADLHAQVNAARREAEQLAERLQHLELQDGEHVRELQALAAKYAEAEAERQQLAVTVQALEEAFESQQQVDKETILKLERDLELLGRAASTSASFDM